MIDNAVKRFAAGLDRGDVVIDIGAGDGNYRNNFHCKKYVAIDIGIGQPIITGLDVVGDITKLPFRDSSFDAAICVEVLEHVYEREVFIAEIRRVLKKGGRLLLTSPLCFGVHMEPYDFFRYTEYGLKNSFETNGFRVASIVPRGGYFMVLAHLSKMFPYLLLKSTQMPSWLRKNLERLLAPVFTYLIPFFLFRLDRLDKSKKITLGYVCLAENVK